MGTDVVRRRAGAGAGARPHRAAGVAVAAALLGTALACGGGGDDTPDTADAPPAEGGAGVGSAGGALAEAAASEGTADDGGDVHIVDGDVVAGDGAEPGGGGATGGAAPELPPPTFPAAAPPTTVAGTEALSVPGADGDDPLFGQVFVDLEPGGHGDYAVQLRQGQHVQVLSSADDGILTHTEVFAPDGTVVGQWESGEPGSITGYYWDDADVLPLTGTYIFRVRHVGGGHDRFVLTFYGQA